jgi:general secretion pathway protein J
MRLKASTIQSTRGFTLIEVVLALTIFALMASILYGAFSLGQNAVAKSQGGFEKNQKLRSMGDLLGSYIRSSYPYRASPQDPAVFYEGEENRLTFVSSYSLAMGGRGMAKIHIFRDGEENGAGTLKLEEEIPLRLGDESAGGGVRNQVALQEGIKELRLAYLQPRGDTEIWEDRWDARERRMLPRAVRLSYRTDDGQEVRWIIPLMMSVLGP